MLFFLTFYRCREVKSLHLIWEKGKKISEIEKLSGSLVQLSIEFCSTNVLQNGQIYRSFKKAHNTTGHFEH